MRLWAEQLLPYLSKQRILGQHRECCALRGKGWGQNHETVDYVWDYRPFRLVMYHFFVMEHGMNIYDIDFGQNWFLPHYRGTSLGFDESDEWMTVQEAQNTLYFNDMSPEVYPEHNDDYILECIENLEEKGVVMDLARDELLGETVH